MNHSKNLNRISKEPEKKRKKLSCEDIAYRPESIRSRNTYRFCVEQKVIYLVEIRFVIEIVPMYIPSDFMLKPYPRMLKIKKSSSICKKLYMERPNFQDGHFSNEI